MSATHHVTTNGGHGTTHGLTAGRTYKLRGDKMTNKPNSRSGKADCGAITSSAAVLTDGPITCPKCLECQ